MKLFLKKINWFSFLPAFGLRIPFRQSVIAFNFDCVSKISFK
jgi:hypothetical protein